MPIRLSIHHDVVAIAFGVTIRSPIQAGVQQLMRTLTVALVLCGLMAAASVGGTVAKPKGKAPGSPPAYVLEDIVPKQFGTWREVPQSGAQVVNPQTQEILDRLYSQIVSRTYVDTASGYLIMLSLAYGDDQRGDLQAHKPEVCYPAQGFALNSNVERAVRTPFGDIAARRLSTSLGRRQEPVTYWFTMGDTAVRNKWDMRIVEIRLGLTGQIPDGLLFRVSSIDAAPEAAFRMQDKFASDLLAAVTPKDRMRLSGLGTAPAP